MSRETISVPIFPLPLVCFPGMQVPLQRLGATVQQAMEDLIQQDMPLAVSFRQPSRDSGTGDEPHAIGTVARIVGGPGMDYSNLNYLVGIARIHLLSYRRDQRHLTGQARFLPDVDEPVPAMLVDEAKACISELWSAFMSEHRMRTFPKEAEAVSYWIARYLPVNEEQQQELLELRTTTTRLAKEVAILRSLLDSLRSEHQSS